MTALSAHERREYAVLLSIFAVVTDWDAQQDMLADTLGGIVSMLPLARGHDRTLGRK